MRIFLFIICISGVIAGCTKAGVAPANLIGTWELRHYSGTIAGVDKNIPAGNGTLLQFNDDSTYRHFTNFKADYDGHFRIVKNGVNWPDEKHDAIYFSEDLSPDFLIVTADSLIIGNTYPDGVTSLYVRTQ